MEQNQNYKLGELILSIKEGNVAAVSEIYMMVGKAMMATAYSYVRNNEESINRMFHCCANFDGFCCVCDNSVTNDSIRIRDFIFK